MNARGLLILSVVALAACEAALEPAPQPPEPSPEIVRSGPCDGVLELAMSGPFTAALMDDGGSGFLMTATPEQIACAQENDLPVSHTLPG
ncbi:hypothetical protein [Flavimaricola marinus]|uniref:Lipoprotein n=1 Tax=Flavimaricola marinus TaxID=1819565 RepID=A0A238LD12_9RHOB|nr:hypothetical protein [Flavimaricola marinus]SMY07443.1 hypothetical protein LOM8899_01578 [Flavimaricola marinus]